MQSPAVERAFDDKVSNVLKWVLLATAVICFGLMGWATDVTYRASPPMPERFLAPDGSALMTSASIEAGKAAFQRADLMDYGSLYGMGSYFGEDYTAQYLVRLGELTQDNIARVRFGKTYAELGADEQSLVHTAMQRELQGIDLSGGEAHLPPAVAGALRILKREIGSQLLHQDFIRGWTQAYSLDAASASDTADFILYSSLTTVARRPGSSSSWTQNWPYEPLVGNTPASSTFLWTWISFCFTFFCFGVVLASPIARARPLSAQITARLLALDECLAQRFNLVVGMLSVELPKQPLLQRHMVMQAKYTQGARRRHNEQLRDIAGQHFVVEPCSNCGLVALFLVLFVGASVMKALLILVVLAGMLVAWGALLGTVHAWLWKLHQLQVQFVACVTEQSQLAAIGDSDGRAVGVLHE